MLRKFIGYTLNVLIIAAALLAWMEYRRDNPIARKPETDRSSRAA